MSANKIPRILAAVCKASQVTLDELRQGGHDDDRTGAREAACVLMLAAGVTPREASRALWRQRPKWAEDCRSRALRDSRRECWAFIGKIKKGAK